MGDCFEKFSIIFLNKSITILSNFFYIFKAILEFFLSVLPIFGIFLPWYLDYYLKISFDLKVILDYLPKVILFFSKDDFIHIE